MCTNASAILDSLVAFLDKPHEELQENHLLSLVMIMIRFARNVLFFQLYSKELTGLNWHEHCNVGKASVCSNIETANRNMNIKNNAMTGSHSSPSKIIISKCYPWLQQNTGLAALLRVVRSGGAAVDSWLRMPYSEQVVTPDKH